MKSSIEKALHQWMHQGLISQEQFNKIKEYENSKSETSWILTSLFILGAVTIGMGCISLIAANWDYITGSVKLIVDFIILMFLGFGIIQAQKSQRPYLYETLIVIFNIFILASIGLISQVYHTGGQLYQALFLWLSITFAITYHAKTLFAPFLWSITLSIALFIANIYSDIYLKIFDKNSSAFFMSITLLYLLLGHFFKKIESEQKFSKPFNTLAIVLGMISLIVTELAVDVLFSRSSHTADFSNYFLGIILFAIIFIFIMTDQKIKKIHRSLYLSALSLYVGSNLLLHFTQNNSIDITGTPLHIAKATLTILTLGFTAFYFAGLLQKKMFQFILILIGLRFLALFFKALGSFALTGFGLIISGVFILGLTYLWNKYRQQLASWAEGWANEAK